MIDLKNLEDLSLLRESVDMECKLAQGKDGQGEIPKDFWSTYSAMANAHGGVVLLGVREKEGKFSIAGLSNATKLRTDLFNNLNSAAKVSTNLLTDTEVEELRIDDKVILAIRIPQATRKQKPVFLHGQPLGNTYRRLNDGDRKCDDETVKRMLAEQLEDSRDTRILDKFGMRDLDADSLRAYRNAFAVHRPGHPWLNTDDDEFLRLIGGWREDRASGEAGLTAAGLLMFGQWTSIAEAFPLYFLDYQERPADAQSQTRWLDRIVPDGAWSGNLYDFFRRVIRKLTEDLKVPFVLQGGERVDDTPAHQALREALVNALIHADYTGRASVLVVKQPSGFVFRNPGMMRVPVAQALAGGASDCRNRSLHQMFLFINLGERAGSGLPKIRSGWEDMGHEVRLADSFEPYEQTTLEMNWGFGFSGVLTETPLKTPLKTPEKILAAMRHQADITIPELAHLLEKSESAIKRAIRKLRDADRIERVGGDKGGHWEVRS